MATVTKSSLNVVGGLVYDNGGTFTTGPSQYAIVVIFTAGTVTLNQGPTVAPISAAVGQIIYVPPSTGFTLALAQQAVSTIFQNS